MAVRGRVERHGGHHVGAGGDLRSDGENGSHVDVGAAIRQGAVGLTILIRVSCHDLKVEIFIPGLSFHI